MKINKAYKFRLYPNRKQEELINKTLGSSRFIYNYMLRRKQENKVLTTYDMIKEIPSLLEEYQFLKEVDSCALRCAIFDLENGLKKHYKERIGYPRYKVKGKKDTYRTNYIKSEYKGKKYENIKLDLKRKIITLPKLKEIKIRGYRKLEKINGRIINATIEKVAKKYYVSICVEEEIKKREKKEIKNIVGIDVGIKSLVVTSDGELYGNPNYIKKYERKIKGLQKSISRKEKGSKNYIKTKNKIQEVYRKLQNARRKTNEEIVKKIIESHDIIVSENLQVNKMIEKENKSLRKLIINSTMSDIIRRIKYKCDWENKEYYQVDRYYASSQICSRCGKIKKDMKDINKREYECDNCGLKMDRDLNASINIMTEGLFKEYRYE